MAWLFWLSDAASARIGPHLPHGQPGKPGIEDGLVIRGILRMLKVGCRWQGTPSAYGPHTMIYNRYNRRSQREFWQQLFAKIAAAGPVQGELLLDSSHVKAHRSAAGGNVWPASSASGLDPLVGAVCINVSGLSASRWPRWRSMRPEPYKGVGVERDLPVKGFQNIGRLSGYLPLTARRRR